MSDFSWDYVTRTASDALTELGRSIAATIAQAVEPGLYLAQPDIVYEVRDDGDQTVVLRNGVVVGGPEACPDDTTLALIAAEMAGVVQTIDLRSTMAVSVEF